MLGDVDAEDRVVIVSRVTDLAAGVFEILFFQIVDLNALDRRDPHVVKAVVYQDLARMRVDRLFLLRAAELDQHNADRRRQKQYDQQQSFDAAVFPFHPITCLSVSKHGMARHLPDPFYHSIPRKRLQMTNAPLSRFLRILHHKEKIFIDKQGCFCYYMQADG